MTLLASFIAAHIGTVVTVLGGLAAIVVAWFHGRSTGVKSQQPIVQAAQAKAEVAQTQAGEALANVRASADALDAVKVTVSAQQSAAAIPVDQLDAQLDQLGALRKD